MQKISTYLYPNRIQLLADLAGFNVEFTNVYQKIVKIYKGVDNVIEFDVKNADQKRIELNSSNSYTPPISDIQLNIMDASNNLVGNYEVTLDTGIKGIARSVILSNDLVNLDHQFLKYSVTATDTSGNTIPLYGDTRFGVLGTIELVGDAMPVTRDERVYSSFQAEIDLKGVPTWHSSAIPSTFYEAVPTTELAFSVDIKGFTGSVWIEATKASTISSESFKNGSYLDSYSFENFTGAWQSTLSIDDYKYFRVSYTTPLSNGIGASFEVTLNNGHYDVQVKQGGTGYAIGSQIKVLGSMLGGVDEINDLILTVSQIDNATGQSTSSYAQSSITHVAVSGTAAAGSTIYMVTGTNITGSVDKITVS